ncbi:MAG: PssE/Cps14G family polysaccharide biosynthesis glycosyltransferase [Phycisphaerales bacterium]
MIFLTVGTQFPFDRLVTAVDRIAGEKIIDEEIFAQIGESSYIPKNFKAIKKMDAELFERFIRNSTAIISHSGMGTIENALKYEKPMLVLPRLKKFGEVVNDHQLAIAKRFEDNGYLLAACDEKDLRAKIFDLKTFTPQKRISTSEAIIQRISKFLNSINKEIYDYSARK